MDLTVQNLSCHGPDPFGAGALSSRIGAIVQFDTFLMERNQTLFENGVEINLTESGVHPCTIEEILPAQEAQALLEDLAG